MQNQKGFTLIELMIVIAIIAILAAIALPAYTNYVAKSQVTEAIELASSYKTPVSLSVSETGLCPLGKKEGTTPADNLGQYVKTIVIGSAGGTGTNNGACTITATMGSTGVSTKAKSGTIILTSTAPSVDDATDTGVTKWTCTSTLPASLLPNTCTVIAKGI